MLLKAENIDKRFGITHAVNNVSINIEAGEIRALIGENGSGKSTFCQMLCGIYSIGGGTFTLDGQVMHVRNQVEANNLGVSIIVQEMGTLSGLSVAENIFLGHEEPFMHYGIKDTGAMIREAQKLLDSYGFGSIKAGNMIDNYNFEDRKLVEIVKATYMKPKILIVDET
ncbi:MAG: sugar ABC transporter ATP-binding protein, partial [Synergistaceae bacterium]|nr:sugar ABC transporter ATP-binding protein [Synergistaceae bacterium]